MRRDRRLKIITDAITNTVPRPGPSRTTVAVTHNSSMDGQPPHTIWTGTPQGLAERIYTALYGRPDTGEELSPLARAEDAKRRRNIEDEIDALTSAHDRLTSAPWYPAHPGDLVHVHYEQAGDFPAFGETYIVGSASEPGDAGPDLLSLQLLAHTCPGDEDDVLGMVGCFSVEAADEPLYEAWFEAGPHRLTIVRDGRPVHTGGAR